MNLLARWGKFNLVGILGAGAQLGSLAVLNRIVPAHYLLDTAVAIELTLIHNFLWHLHYTWRERRQRPQPLAQCMRFHLSNGVVSFAGNLALMRLLVESAGVPVLAANVIAITCCSLFNFCLAETWAFRRRPEPNGG